ncbi:MAG: Rieske (2Fe-2S) protein [Acidimicrobiia bacterium]
MALHKIADATQIVEGDLLCVKVGDQRLCLGRTDAGRLFAVDDICSHDEFELSDGHLDGVEVECPAHGSRFNVFTGDVSGLPATEPIKVFPLTVEGDDVYVDVDL